MSDKKLNAIKEIEFRINKIKERCSDFEYESKEALSWRLDDIDTLLFDIKDFINDLKDKDENN